KSPNIRGLGVGATLSLVNGHRVPYEGGNMNSFDGDNYPSQMIQRIDVVQDNCLQDRKSTRLNSSHVKSSYAVFCLKKKITSRNSTPTPAHQNATQALRAHLTRNLFGIRRTRCPVPPLPPARPRWGRSSRSPSGPPR